MSDPLMDVAWRDFILWAAHDKNMVTAFNAANDRQSETSLTSHMAAFVRWVTEHHWGIDESPDAVKAEIMAMRAETAPGRDGERVGSDG